METEKTDSDGDIEILRFNYKNLHDSFWGAHNFGWLVTSIFVPVLFTGLGFFVKEYDGLSTFQVVMGAVGVEFFVVVWWLIMLMLDNYNEVRRQRLKEIEELCEGQYQKHTPDGKPLLQQYCLHYRSDVRKLRVSPNNIYGVIVAGFTVLNLALVLARAFGTR